MPRGVAKSGVRMTARRRAANTVVEFQRPSDAQVLARLNDSFDAMNTMALATCLGVNKTLIISGPAGVGKSYGVMKTLDDLAGQKLGTVIKGYVRPTGLYKLLYENRHEDCVLVFDDADSIFADDVSLNLLKAACDMTRTRRLSWMSETKMEDEDGERVPRSFEFQGSIIFITNYDFDDLIDRGNKLAPHFQALISRSHYLDVGIKTKQDYVVRLRQVVARGMLREEGFTAEQEADILAFVELHQDTLRELSLRMVLKIAGLMRMGGDWEKLARATCMR